MAVPQAEITQPIRDLAPPFTERSFGLGIRHEDGLLGGVISPPWKVRLSGRRLPFWWYVTPDAVGRSLGRAGAGSATSRTRTRLRRPATAEAFALGGHLAAFLRSQFAGQATSNSIRL